MFPEGSKMYSKDLINSPSNKRTISIMDLIVDYLDGDLNDGLLDSCHLNNEL